MHGWRRRITPSHSSNATENTQEGILLYTRPLTTMSSRYIVMKTGIVLVLVLQMLSSAVGFAVQPSFDAYTWQRHSTSSQLGMSLATPESVQPKQPIIQIKPKALERLKELREKEKADPLVLRMGVRKGGCSGLSYVMNFAVEDDIQDGDSVYDYPEEKIKCVVDAKAVLYLYGLELDYSDKLVGGGFKFFNPNAEKSCGCGSSFGV